MVLPPVSQLRQIIMAALGFVGSLIILFFVGGTLVNYNPNQMAMAIGGQPVPIFDSPQPSQFPLYSAVLMLLILPLGLGVWFMQVRLAVLVPSDRVALYRLLSTLHFLGAATALIALVALHYAEFFALDDAEFRTFAIVGAVGMYFSLVLGGIDHVLVGVWVARHYADLRGLGWTTVLIPGLGLVLQMTSGLNTHLSGLRLVLPIVVITSDASLWAFYLVWLIVAPPSTPAADDDATLQLSSERLG